MIARLIQIRKDKICKVCGDVIEKKKWCFAYPSDIYKSYYHDFCVDNIERLQSLGRTELWKINIKVNL